jgi:tRNA nucleotidyltransferase (CCA-adding enzyme)
MGTPTEDAQRRDFTFNALFLNVQSQSVEDLCGTGIDDLRAGLIRTPLPPLQTFADDPLRVLRAVRFASRFGFAMHQELVRNSIHGLFSFPCSGGFNLKF